eukprot:CAMPEP_0196654918 /NCGR_PEP_ID=MMETSP1086-20130531/4654_1 /TAXON_ID=77921 /ORGANISM="Cyanoptyche  gloeocystis , Strain SAG4.97" /LENGTH=428 /DNA_ID=CAMNT_0041986955 /DNA_START=99 /DNA_END=1386 /DNA_ORIENTATION=+
MAFSVAVPATSSVTVPLSVSAQSTAYVSSAQAPGTTQQSRRRESFTKIQETTFLGRKAIEFEPSPVQRNHTGFAFKVHAVATPTDASTWEKLNEELVNESPRDVIADALERFGNEVAISFSGAEDVILIEYAQQTGLPFRVFSLDTGRLHPETYQLFDKVEKHYGIHIEYTFPEAAAVEKLVREKGMFSFYEDGHNECCGIRKVQPLRKHLSTLKAWITGQRKDQSPGTRSSIPVVQLDPAFKGQDGGDLIKYNPLANTSSYDVWYAIRMLEVPYNALHERGFVSIGCEPCTKPVLPSQHEREAAGGGRTPHRRNAASTRATSPSEPTTLPAVFAHMDAPTSKSSYVVPWPSFGRSSCLPFMVVKADALASPLPQHLCCGVHVQVKVWRAIFFWGVPFPVWLNFDQGCLGQAGGVVSLPSVSAHHSSV